MYIRKDQKIEIIKWYIKKYVQRENPDADLNNLDNINNLKQLEDIVRNNKNIFGEISKCNQCSSHEKDYCPKCERCIVTTYNKNAIEKKDNYTFSYNYWKRFYDLEK